MVRLIEAFPDPEKVICSIYFISSDLNESSWNDLEALVSTDDVTFWTVFAHHPKLQIVLNAAWNLIDTAHHSASPAVRRSVNKEQVQAITSFFVRVACETEECVRRSVDCEDLARRIHFLLPLKQFLVLNEAVLHRNGSMASTLGYTLHILNPLYLTGYHAFMLEWRETIDQLVKRCLKQLTRGRYQRLSGDILLLFEQTYRSVKQLWALVFTCPFVVQRLPLSQCLRSLRIITDVISPMLQHFLLTCEGLSTRRVLFSKANAGVINAAVQTAAALILFRPFCMVSTDSPLHSNQPTAAPSHFILPELMKRIEERVMDFSRLYVNGFAESILLHWGPSTQKTQTNSNHRHSSHKHQRTLHLLYQSLAPLSTAREATNMWIGPVLLHLKNPTIPDSKDFAVAIPKRQRFFEFLLLELVNQKVELRDLLKRDYLSQEEAETLMELQEAVLCTLAGITLEEPPSAPAPAPAAPCPSPPPTRAVKPCDIAFEPDSLGSIIQDVFPDFHPLGIKAALAHYNDDIEMLINDASMNNLPPQLVELMYSGNESSGGVAAEFDACESAVREAPAEEPVAVLEFKPPEHLTQDDFDGDALVVDYSVFVWDFVSGPAQIASPSTAAPGGEEEEAAEWNDMLTMGEFSAEAAAQSSFDISEEMKEKIRIMNEIMYEDELDDGIQLERWNRKRGLGDGSDTSDSDDAEQKEGAALPQAEDTERGEEGEASQGPAAKPLFHTSAYVPRSDYENKRYHANREKDHKKRVNERVKEREENAPAYAKKTKSVKAKKPSRQGKAEGKRAIKKMMSSS